MGRVGTVDIGAFESRGFTMTAVAGGSPQTAAIGTSFANPLAVSVTANNPAEPVNGGIVTFANTSRHGTRAVLETHPSKGGQAVTIITIHSSATPVSGRDVFTVRAGAS